MTVSVRGPAKNSISDLQRTLGHRFADETLLRQALTHRSYGQPNNERLEFLGDSILNFIVAELLYLRFPQLSEGELSRLRANLVRQESLVVIAQRIGLSAVLLLGEGEVRSGGRERASILGDALEAIVAAVYRDAGFDVARRVLTGLFEPLVRAVDLRAPVKDAKTLLQEYLQGRHLARPVYTVLTTHGAAHDQIFEVECVIEERQVRVRGTGPNRRAAEQVAARQALLALAPDD